MTYTIRTDIAVPPPLKKFNTAPREGRKAKYPFADLPIGSSFVVPVEADQDFKKVKTNVAHAAQSHVKTKNVTDRSFIVRHWIDDTGNAVLDEQGRRQVVVVAVQPKSL